MNLHRALGHIQPPGNLLVALAPRQTLHDLPLTCRQVHLFRHSALLSGGRLRRRHRRTGLAAALRTELLHQLHRHGLGNDRFAALGLADGGHQRLGLDILREIAHCAGAQRLSQLLGLFRNGQDHHLRLRHVLREQMQRLQPRQPRHVQIQQDHVRTQRLGALQPLQPVGRLGHDAQVLLTLQQLTHAGAEQVVIIDKQNADAHLSELELRARQDNRTANTQASVIRPFQDASRSLCDRYRETSVPCPGALHICSCPPRRAARSRMMDSPTWVSLRSATSCGS